MRDKIDGWVPADGISKRPIDGYTRLCPCCALNVGCDEDGLCNQCGACTCSLDELRALLAEHGLSIVGEADMAVLRACSEMTIGTPSAAPRPPAKHQLIPKAGVLPVVDAEFARRAAQKGTGT